MRLQHPLILTHEIRSQLDIWLSTCCGDLSWNQSFSEKVPEFQEFQSSKSNSSKDKNAHENASWKMFNREHLVCFELNLQQVDH